MRGLRPIALGLLSVALLAYFFVHPPRIAAGGMDFDAFYCAARVSSTGFDPYRYEPLRSCEHANRQWRNLKDVVPAPLPPYALAMLIPLARLPYAQAAFLWFIMILATTLVIVGAIIQLTDLPLLVVGPSIAVAVLTQALPTGSLAPVILALLCAAAVSLKFKRWNATGVFLGFACVEPHVALPALLVTFVLIREMRIPIAIVGVALAALSLIPAGLALNVEYFTQVLPGHASFELGSVVQFSLSSMLHNLGWGDRAALAVGSLQYVLFALAGIWLARPFSRDDPSVTVLIPIALAVTGGTYIHLSQIAAVLPLAFVIARRTRSKLVWLGIVLLTLPWNLLNALTPGAVMVPRFDEAVTRALMHQTTAGGFAYIANALVYLGIACTLWGLFVARRQILGPIPGTPNLVV